jgi:hypothetical protein
LDLERLNQDEDGGPVNFKPDVNLSLFALKTKVFKRFTLSEIYIFGITFWNFGGWGELRPLVPLLVALMISMKIIVGIMEGKLFFRGR